MAQSAKVIDVSRTYLPVDPQAFPQNMHSTQREDSPERGTPVVPYQGHNFMPTGYGYKSYFGTGSKIDIDALGARVDHVFIFQNDGFENVIIALTESGVWYKNGATAGAWTNVVAYTPDVDPQVHYDWSFCVINDALYCYMQGKGSYVKIVSATASPFISVSQVVPNFLNMSGQIGIFKAGNRLGFWDSADSFAWSNLDDFTDFTPSLETLAGNVTFADVKGRVVTVIGHGEGFIIYSTKSIVYIEKAPDTLFQWNPRVVLGDVGIVYGNQAVSSNPDWIHFAWTTTGVYKIEQARAEVLIPEVWDYLKDSVSPISLKLIEGRYLAFEIIEEGFVTGKIVASDGVAEPLDYVFQGTTAVEPPNVDGGAISWGDACLAVGQAGEGQRLSGENGGTGPAVSPPNTSPTTLYEPIWTAYLSRRTVLPDNIVWGAVPCATVDPNGVEKNQCPGDTNNLSKWTTDANNKRATTGAEAYVDGKWTMERFVAAQSAIWKAEEDSINAFINAVVNRASSGTKITNSSNPFVGDPLTVNECLIGRWPSKWTPPKFGYSTCAFWLTRICTDAVDIYRRKTNIITAEDTMQPNQPISGYVRIVSGNINFSPIYASAEAAAAVNTNGVPEVIADTGGNWNVYFQDTADGGDQVSTGAWLVKNSVSGVTYDVAIAVIWSGIPGKKYRYLAAGTRVSQIPNVGLYDAGGQYRKTETMYAHNVAKEASVLAIESAYCEITSWRYKDNNGTTQTTAAGACATNANLYNKGLTSPNGRATDEETLARNMLGDDGSFCGLPFEPTLAIDGSSITWPTITVTLPGATFFLQKGSKSPVYPTYEGAYVYDLHLKKWGKMKLRYKQLLDYSPINANLNGVIPYETFGIIGGVIKGDGFIYLFDERPTDSFITWGKIGYFRQGTTQMEEIRVDFKIPSTGVLRSEASLEGRNLSAGFDTATAFTAAESVTLQGGYPGKWHNITISGQYDICYMEYRGYTAGRR